MPQKLSCEGSSAFILFYPTVKELINHRNSQCLINTAPVSVFLLTWCVLPHRHSSYGRLLDDHDYGSWGNYNNPLYDDS
uniref:Uncharacterized protein n=1 Tax=Anser cygnoides TaxID=8845 RepID=A0A8B9E9X4_ANSCY